MKPPGTHSNQTGISLLEATLSLSLISLMLAGGVRWVHDSVREHKAMTLARQQGRLVEAANDYLRQHIKDVRFRHNAPGTWVAVRLGGNEAPFLSAANPGWGRIDDRRPGLAGLSRGNTQNRQVCLMVQPAISGLPLRAMLMTRGNGPAPDMELARRAAAIAGMNTGVGTGRNAVDGGAWKAASLDTLIAPSSYPNTASAGGCDASLAVDQGDLVTPLVVNADDGDVVSQDFLLRETDPTAHHIGNHFETDEYLADTASAPAANALVVEHGDAAAGTRGELRLDGQSLTTSNYVLKANQAIADFALALVNPDAPFASSQPGDAAGSVDTRVRTRSLVTGNGGLYFNRYRNAADGLPGDAIPFLAPALNLAQPGAGADPLTATLPRVRVDSLLRLMGPTDADQLALYNYPDVYYDYGRYLWNRNEIHKRPAGLSAPGDFTLRGMAGPYAFNSYYLPTMSDILDTPKKQSAAMPTYKDKNMDITGTDTTFAHSPVSGVPCQPSGLLTLLGEYRDDSSGRQTGYRDRGQTDPDYTAAALAYCARPSRDPLDTAPSTWYFPLVSREPFNPEQISWMLTQLNDPAVSAKTLWDPKKSSYHYSISYGQKSSQTDRAKFGVASENALNRNPDLVEKGDLDWTMADFPARKGDFK
ncbi:hypothetical protein [Paludibacterium paludis]|uniref:Uncharacterized protein n=1 Tax=Paludibacterium paludis TaxID=1225769 RepID=A0A918P552_9NEIS|nr:hypothetical protein [Paludibacterium paludis]GGY20785.1 hypothetical protein GCM10011289_25510 [Paludibacterium paludis]